MDITFCKVTAVKADFASGTLKFSFETKLNEAALAEAEALAMYVDKDAGRVEVRIIPQQLPLIDTRPTAPDDWQAKEDEHAGETS